MYLVISVSSIYTYTNTYTYIYIVVHIYIYIFKTSYIRYVTSHNCKMWATSHNCKMWAKAARGSLSGPGFHAIPMVTCRPCSRGGTRNYPLVNVQKTMENHHFVAG